MSRKILILLVLASLLAAMIPAASASASASSGTCKQWHTVQRGENLYRISLRYGTSVSYLKELNHLPNVNRIYAGQQLCIVPASSGGTAYVVQRGDTLHKIARQFGVNMWVLARNNNILNLNRIYAGQTLIIPDVTIQL